jgi:hypothetical protein
VVLWMRTVSTGRSGVRHSVEVTAESIYEAAALGVSALKSDGWADAIAPGTELEIEVREPATCHRLTVQQIRRWCDGVAVSPDDAEEATVEATARVSDSAASMWVPASTDPVVASGAR